MSLLVWIVAATIVFFLLCWIVALLPVPPGAPPWIKNAFYILLAIVAIVVICNEFLGGGCGNLDTHIRR